MELWIGEEKEGDLKGFYTLFVGSEKIKIHDIDKAMVDYSKIKQIYFGAGRCTKINQKLLKQCLREYPKIIISAEIDINCLHEFDYKLLRQINLMLTINHTNMHMLKYLSKNHYQIKLQNLEKQRMILMTAEGNSFDSVCLKSLKYKIYEGDEVIK